MARNRKQSGNIFFVILLGIILFAAVSAAVVTMSRGSGKDISSEDARLAAASVMRYARQMRDAVDFLYKNNNISEADIRFANPLMASNYGSIDTNTPYQVFAEEGGGLTYQAPPASATTTTANWEIFGLSNLPQVGTSEAELTLVLPNVKLAVCQAINASLGYSETATPPVDDYSDSKCVYSATASDRFAGTFKTGGNINSLGTSGFTVLPAYQACVSCNGAYYYYNTLLER